MNEMIGRLTTTNPDHMVLWVDIVQKGEKSKRDWIERLRREGYKAAHPNDGWVDREVNTFRLVYAHFNDGLEIGDKVMLGWEDYAQRPVKVIGVLGDGMFRYQFEDLQAQSH